MVLANSDLKAGVEIMAPGCLGRLYAELPMAPRAAVRW